MLLRSFRVQIALLSTLISGIVLTLFAGFSWVVVERAAIAQAENALRGLVHRALPAQGPPENHPPLSAALERAYGVNSDTDLFYLVRGRDGTARHATANWPGAPLETLLPSPPPLAHEGPPFRDGRGMGRGPRARRGPPPPPAESRFVTFHHDGARWRVGTFSMPMATVHVGINLDRTARELNRARYAFLLGLPVGLLLIGAGGFFLAQRALRPVQDLREMAERITAKGLNARLHPRGTEDEEFQRLIDVFNGMLDRLQRSFAQATRFTADAAHELKTPLAILQGGLELLIQGAQDGSHEQQRYEKLLEEVQRLKGIIRKLLLLAQADAGTLPLAMKPVALSAMVDAVCEDAAILAPQLQINKHIAPGIVVAADEHLLHQVVQNLVNNALKYNREEGQVTLRLQQDRDCVRLHVENTGGAIPLEDQRRIFERFYRSDKARTRGNEGIGLGLSLAREIARAHGGELALAGSRDDKTVFTLELPLHAP